MNGTLALVVPALFASVGVVAALTLDAVRQPRIGAVIAALFLGAGGVVSGMASTAPPRAVSQVWAAGGGFSALAGVILVAGALTLFSTVRTPDRPGASEGDATGEGVSSLIVLASLASAAVAVSADLLLSVIAIETAAVCAYALVAARRGGFAPQAALRYFVQGSVATAMLLIAVGILALGSEQGLGIRSLALAALPPTTLAGALAFAAAGFAFKSGAAPFHAWVPDAYEASQPEVAAFLATAPKTGAVAALIALVVVGREAGGMPWLSTLLAAGAVTSMVVGTAGALVQRSYTRMLGYSSIAQAGFALIALAVGAAEAAGFFMATYAAAAITTFAAAGVIRRRRPGWDGSVQGLAGLGREAPVLSAAMGVGLLSLTGVPPLLGFWGKLAVFVAAIGAGWTWLAVFGLLASVASFAFYGNVLRVMYFSEPTETRGGVSGPFDPALVAVVATAAMQLLGLALLARGLGPVLATFSYQWMP